MGSGRTGQVGEQRRAVPGNLFVIFCSYCSFFFFFFFLKTKL